ncbi:MAG: SulP family inorganic anion transporter, partial [Aeromicrobium sp.]
MSRLSAHLLPTMRGYRRTWLRADVVGGLSAGAVVIPQAMAYATIADLPVEIGLYTCMVPMAVYALLGGARTTSVSTTSTIATLTAATFISAGLASSAEDAQSALLTLTLMVGLILLAARVLRLGPIVENISHATLTGIQTGVGLTVACSQLPKLLGVEPDNEKEGFFRVFWSAVEQIGDASGTTIALSAGSIAIALLLPRILPRLPAPIVVVALGIVLAAVLDLDQHGVLLIDEVPSGLPSPALPSLHHVGDLLPGAVAIAVMAFLETVAVGRGVRRPDEPQIRSNTELLANGVSSVAGSFFHALPPAGGFSQTAVNVKAGGRTQLASLVTAGLAVLVALFLAPVLSDLPQATLGSLVIVAVLGLIDPTEFARLRRIDPIEFWIALATAVVGLTLGLLPAVLTGVALTLVLLLHELNHPHVAQLVKDLPDPRWTDLAEDADTVPSDPLVLRLRSALYTANIRATLDEIRARIDSLDRRPRAVVLDLDAIGGLTVTVLDA